MATQTTGGSTTSFTNTPQAVDDTYSWTEDQLSASELLAGNVITLDVMVNDLGGNAQALFSIDDGNGNTIASDYELLNSDVINGVSGWEATANGNLVRIVDGKIELKLVNLSAINSLTASDPIQDEFVYGIRLANGTISQAWVTVDILGQNDAASISGTDTGSVVEAGGVNNGISGTPTAGGTLTVSDIDTGGTHFHTVPPESLNGTYGTFTFNTTSGEWTYTLTDGAADVQALSVDQHVTDKLLVKSVDGTASQLITVNISGTNDAAVLSADVADLTEINSVADISTSGTLTISDVDSPATFQAQTDHQGLYGKFSIDAAGHWTYAADNAHNEFVAGTTYTDTFTVNSADNTETTVTMNILGSAVNNPPLLNVGSSVSTNEQEAVALDTNAVVTDVDLDPLNGGAGNYGNAGSTLASLTIARNGGGNAQDTFAFDTSGGTFMVSGTATSGNLQSGGNTFATYANAGGTLTINFTSSGTAATTALVNDVVDHITYTNTSDTPPASVTLDYTFNDGSPDGGQGSGATATGSTTVNITAVNDLPVLT